MKFLIDVNLSPRLAVRLNEIGHDAVHAADLGLLAEPDEVVLATARADGRVVVSADATSAPSWPERGRPRRLCCSSVAASGDASTSSRR